MGVAIRTKKPLDLHLAPLVWKQLCCIPLLLEDLEEVDLLYVQTLKSILHIEDSGITEDNFHEVRKAFCLYVRVRIILRHLNIETTLKQASSHKHIHSLSSVNWGCLIEH